MLLLVLLFLVESWALLCLRGEPGFVFKRYCRQRLALFLTPWKFLLNVLRVLATMMTVLGLSLVMTAPSGAMLLWLRTMNSTGCALFAYPLWVRILA